VSEPLIGYSNADLEAVCLLAHDLAEQQSGRVTAEIFQQAVADYLPARDTRMLEYMELLAVFETSRRSLVPERLRHLSGAELNERLRALRSELRI
jgi:transitional endoplasmic reticulum ATPase